LFVDGIIYNKNNEDLIEGFLHKGEEFVKELDGSFIIFLVSGSNLLVFTDRVGSLKVFFCKMNGIWHVSNNIDCLPLSACHLSMDGLACYLTNGVMLNNLTIFDEVRSVERASVTTFSSGVIASKTYWKIEFKYASMEETDQEALAEELEHLMVEAVRSRIATMSRGAISLSAGHDARTLLGIMRKYLNVPEMFCFSYSLPENNKKNSDSFLAKELASSCNYPHEIKESYKGDLVNYLIKNAKQGKVLTHICEELETWQSISEKGYTDVFCGDECFGYFNVPLDTRDKLLGLIAITGAPGLKWLQTYIPSEIYNELCSSLDQLTDDIYKRTEPYQDPHDKKDFLYIDQRLNNVLMPWRENICSQVGFVHNPYLDSRILDFIMKLPPDLRKEKIFFKKVIRKMLPELFSIELAKASGYNVNWEEELDKNKDELIRFVEETDSQLDSVIPKKGVIEMIKNQSSFVESGKKAMIRSLFYLRKKNKTADKMLDPIMGPMLYPKGQPVFPDLLLLRLLLIRTYFIK
jgi:asparagine synthase (glutamine-hydrolysing)